MSGSVEMCESTISGDTKHDSQVYMSCIMQGHRLGASYYDSGTQELFVLEAWEDANENFPTVQLLKHQAQPVVIFSSTKMDEAFLGALRESDTNTCMTSEVKVVKSSMFSYEHAWHRLTFLHVHGMLEDLSNKERTYLLKSMMNLDSEMQVRAAGGLIAILQEEHLIETVDVNDDESTNIQIQRIAEISLEKFLIVDAAAHDALQIFQVDKHPSYMGIGKSKEGFSLFGMFVDKCVTLMGRRLLRKWFLRPILDLHVLNDRLNFISVFCNCDDMVTALHDALKQVKDIPCLLKKFCSPSSSSSSMDWQQLSKSISSILHIRNIIEVGVNQHQNDSDHMVTLNIVKKILMVPSEELFYVSDIINGAIDFDQTCGENADTMIAYGLCEELDELKHVYDGLPDFLNQIALMELGRVQQQNSSLVHGSIVFMPQVGYLMCFGGKELDANTLEKLPDFELAFVGGDEQEKEYFYRSSKTKELDSVLGDIHHKILDMERAILHDLELRVRSSSLLLTEAASIVAELDCLLSLTCIAHDYNYARPTLTDENLLHIKDGRHALQEVTVDTFIPNDTHISAEGKVNIITGPNFSGKSTYVKQIALIVFLSHIGSFVPATEAIIGLTDRIFSMVPDKHTATIQQSTFMMDLHHIATMLRNATPKSLCILDEFGEGTLTSDGVALLCSTLQYFSFHSSPPKVFACTHFSEVFDEELLPKNNNIRFYTMSILERRNNNKTDILDVTFLYRLVSGYAVPSFGIHCAELAGVASEILDRAAAVIECIRDGKPIERISDEKMIEKERLYKVIVESLLAFDVEHGNVHDFLQRVFTSNSV